VGDEGKRLLRAGAQDRQFLGSLITSDGKSDTEIHKRIRTAKYSFVKLKAKLFSKPYFS
jgi:hypothetical protein